MSKKRHGLPSSFAMHSLHSDMEDMEEIKFGHVVHAASFILRFLGEFVFGF